MTAVFTTRSTPLILAGMAVERFISICFPLHFSYMCTVRHTLLLIGVILILAATPPITDLLITVIKEPPSFFHSVISCDHSLLFPDSSIYYKNCVFDGLYLSFVALILLYTYCKIMLTAQAASTSLASVKRARNTVLLHGVQLLLCMLTFVVPSLQAALISIFPQLIIEIRYVFFLVVYIIPRFMSPVIYGFRDELFRKSVVRKLRPNFTMVKEALPSWVHQDSEEGLVHVNVGGLKRSLCSSTLKKFPDTRLGKLLACDSEEDILQVCDDYDIQEKEFYFDRNPGLFPYVLHFYQTGKLHVMEELCVFSFSQEIEYWGINEFFLDTCCSYRYHDRKLERGRHRSWDDESDVSSVDTSVDEISDLNKDMQHFQEVRYGNIKKCLWLTLENPGYSIPSKLFSLLSIGVVLTSIATMCINSIPEYQTFDSDEKLIQNPTTQALEVFCTCWFTFEVRT
ncbi:hypothetical protein ILYODFUR_009790 [Ilyodon furcidens]|uniref:Delayed-rectifier potassium channel regulatory subunit KCNS1 n=1 Tax=Ilyodon furcidens TaxID=33524 RepID=A0ABV0V2J9_9TELE